MTERAEIERLLNKTGRTLEVLPESYELEEAMKASKRGKERGWTLGEVILHQSDVIELLVGALRDALEKPKQKRQSVKFVPCVCGHNKHSAWYSCENHVWFYDCLKCGLKSENYAAKTRAEAKIGWNKMIEELKAGEVHG